MPFSFFELLEILKVGKSETGRAPGNDEDPGNKFLKILVMDFISTKKHEVEIW